MVINFVDYSLNQGAPAGHQSAETPIGHESATYFSSKDTSEIRGKGTIAIESLSSLKLILDVLFVPNIDQNLLSVGQLLEKGFKVLFEDKFCMIKDANGKNVFKIKMRGKSFALNLLKEEQATVSQEIMSQLYGIRDWGTFIIMECFT
ncbi:hypothetical protein CK203_048842 [Vitis vinifera]|uniref:Retrovirus-related Pol polyprotein from transposon TNT 1-94-like beta-barrel domain-containing protein n=1 Tax=Vitis vinifera TaxID=29760 RepID=A0A438FKW6_VITVI|nr:hypothetical protein CK203_048842 [Vitis vinifera]